MLLDVFKILSAGLGSTLQDRGRSGWGRFGIPPSGAMDDHAAGWANRLLENPPDVPVIELLLQGARLSVLNDAWIAITGADATVNLPLWRAVRVQSGEFIEFPRNRSGVWTYLAVEGGFTGPRFFGSASVYGPGNLGSSLARGDILRRSTEYGFELPVAVAGRSLAWSERRDYQSPPPLRVWPGPQWNCFADGDRAAFFQQKWTVTSRSDRVGYRLSGKTIKSPVPEILSEPVRTGTIQIPENGQPIVTMRDGPTIGGYPKLGMVEPQDLAWLAQCRPGQKIRFELI